MSAPQTMAEIITRIERAMQRVVRAITPLSPAQMLEPRLADSRSVKDVLAHLTWWDQWLIFTYNQPREVSIIQAEFNATCNHLLQRVSQLSIDDLDNADGIAAMIGQPVAPLVLGIYEHYEEHAHELEQLNG